MNPEQYRPERFERLRVLGAMARVAIAEKVEKLDTRLANALNDEDDD